MRDAEAAEFVAAGLALAPVRPPVVPAGTTGFAVVLAPFAELAGRRLAALVGPCAELDGILQEFTTTTAAALGALAARTLVLELGVARVEGRLAGATPEERFRGFAAAAGTRDGLARLFAEYPVLARLVGRAGVNAAAATGELLNRYRADRAELVERLLEGRDPGPLTVVRRSAGDAHRRGRRVAVLRFADGRQVVYKPRPLAADRHFGELVDWFNSRPGTPGLCTPALLERPAYGWVEFVEARACGTRGELDRFYRRQGALLALAHLLDLTDLHHENLIACADHPVLVDLETLFHPPRPAEAGAEDPACRALGESVQRIGLLPQLVLGEDGALDLSGLGGGSDRRSPIEAACWEDAGTDTMRLVRRAGELQGGANRPRLGSADAEPAAHAEALATGFREGYLALLAGRAELAGLLRRFAADEVRVVTRATQVYATVLAESTHPDVLREPGDREGLLHLLGTDAVDDQGWPGLLEHEVAELRDGDVPVFTTRPDSTDLWSGTGARIPGALEQPGLARAAQRLAALDEADLAAQLRIIRTALACRIARPAHPPTAPGTDPGEPVGDLLAAAREIGDLLTERAHRGRGRANWLGVDLIDDRYRRLAACGADLGHGYTGIALFLAQLAAVTGEQRYAETACDALRPLPELLERLAALPDEDLGAVGSGGFAGLGGILYGLSAAAAALDDAGLRALVGPAAALTVRAAAAEQPAGVLDGTAGGLAALLAAHRAQPGDGLWHGARQCADRLAALPVPAAPGFATGAAGIGWALLGFAAEGGGERYASAGTAALRAAVAALGPGESDLSWCSGAAGVALALADRAPGLDGGALARTVAAAGPVAEQGLCHGAWGLRELTRPAVVRHGGPERTEAPGLLTGLAGHGHGLLRLGFADRVPAVLLLAT
ncbi:type 2 lanthipeptide synthetase LanM family protein [Kitasatospora sp. NPDC006697]|uniref:type 2 lanthipeptide synthetase LanM family protein n=1 Tax=Kitasatospora sp. NPDC006697 TaxID=3364020 RepID=UPI0036829589